MARPQTTQPAEPTHQQRYDAVLKRQLQKPALVNVERLPLTREQQRQIDESAEQMKQAEADRLAGRYREARELAVKAREARSRIVGEKHHLTLSAVTLCETMERYLAASEEDRRRLAEADRLYVQSEKDCFDGKYGPALEAAEKTLKTRTELLGDGHPDTARALRALCNAQVELYQIREAEASIKKAQDVLDIAYGRNHPESAVTLDRLGWTYFKQGNLKEALPAFTEAVRVFRQTTGETVEAAEAIDNLGSILVFVNDPRAALDQKLNALAIRERLLGPDARDTGVSCSNLAWLYGEIGQQQEVVPLRKQALAIFEKSLGADHPYTWMEKVSLAQHYRSIGKPAEAIALYEAMVAQDARQPENVTPQTADRALGLGVLYLENDRQADALVQLDRSAEACRKLFTQGYTEAAIKQLHDLAIVYQNRRMIDDAVTVYEQLAVWDEQRAGTPVPDEIVRLTNLGKLYIYAGRTGRAAAALGSAIGMAEEIYGKDALQLTTPLLTLAQAHEAMEHWDEAEKLVNRAVRISEQKLQRDAVQHVPALQALGRIYTHKKKLSMARFSLEEAVRMFENYKEENRISYFLLMFDMADYHKAAGERDKAIEILRDVVQRCRKTNQDIQADQGIYVQARAHTAAAMVQALMRLYGVLDADNPAEREERRGLAGETLRLLDELEKARALDAELRGWRDELSGKA